MNRRLAVVVLALAAFTVSACASPTAPAPKQACQVVSGVQTCPTGP
jgi:hypothetical protein